MTPKEAIAKLASTVSVIDLAREAELSTKTIYRIRRLETNPSLDTVACIEAAVARLRARAKPGRTLKAASAAKA